MLADKGKHFMKRSHWLLFALILLAAGCGGGQARIATQFVPETPTPRSTPLPTVATPPPPGAESNPIALYVPNPGSGRTLRALETAAAALEAGLTETANLAVDVRVVDVQAEAVAALCASGRGQAAAAWLNGVGYAIALESGCGAAALQVERGAGRTASTGVGVRLIANRALNLQEVSALSGRAFCRVSVDDFYTWLVPSLMLRAAGVDPASLQSVVDVGDAGAVISSVAAGRPCAAGGVNAVDYADLADSDARANIVELGQQVVVPYAILTLPPELPLGARTALVEGLQSLALNPETRDTLETLLNMNRLISASASDFAAFMTFMRSTGIDLRAAGDA
jgi:hypothetical protein